MLIDARATGLAESSFDFICSNNTFEHIYPNVLSDILKEFKRVLKADGLMSHFIDLSDNFAHFDHSITIYNFLRFSTDRWNMIDNSIQPQNRLRWKEYKEKYQELDIPITEESIREGELELLAQVDVHPQFDAFSAEELAISHGYLISKFDP
ncbi:MAG: class I SAM-dependent methyltransferase [Flavobacteriales bacterium]|nr:class I SAM-dependent methyltransferase [Flavobacteriales bacterium]